ncbi:GNAT family N-acetyltransferase [Streptomyces diastatochromogenes]|uniref:GNAT family N-acetyltransferase n=1 Tax=Streptomyces diastatochromogenes TaxID=42236 RepID=UPI003662D38B
MDFVRSTPGTDNHPVVVTRVSDTQWHVVEDDRTVGCGQASRRPDGRLFISIDAWHGAVFDRIADAMLADLPTPLYTVVDEADHDSRSAWERAGFATARREWGYLVPTDPQITGLMPAEVLPRPAGTTLLDPSKYAVARHLDQYVGLVRVAPPTRQPRIGLIAVREHRCPARGRHPGTRPPLTLRHTAPSEAEYTVAERKK